MVAAPGVHRPAPSARPAVITPPQNRIADDHSCGHGRQQAVSRSSTSRPQTGWRQGVSRLRRGIGNPDPGHPRSGGDLPVGAGVASAVRRSGHTHQPGIRALRQLGPAVCLRHGLGGHPGPGHGRSGRHRHRVVHLALRAASAGPAAGLRDRPAGRGALCGLRPVGC
ncbi:hypothetical protein SDC9_161545 [bioreactor metagenome]|uniref:Uncharacterized protein n=1 Tax=bioreactor metagenome TaxID=1076179 RepID=A0A645FLK3_9ZZZZ